MSRPVDVIGGGLAGCEAAWQLAKRGVRVRLHEMKPARFSPAHTSESLAELVCSNSFRSDQVHNAVGLLHEELRRMDSLVLRIADETQVPAGRALAVDRTRFSAAMTAAIESSPDIELVREEVTALPDGLAIVATGPLTSDGLARALAPLCGDALYFYDSIAPTVYRDSLDDAALFRASRWEDGPGDYLNSPLSEAQYRAFVAEVVAADKVPVPAFERALYFEACLPIEVMAARGAETLAFGPLKPVGLVPSGPMPAHIEGRPYAVVQLRQEDAAGTLYNLVGFQTRMRQGEQKRVFRMLPGFEKAVFARFGSVHRNTFVRSPGLLSAHLEHGGRPGLYLAGQIAGVEGYVESTALGLLAGINVAYARSGGVAPLPPETTALAALVRHVCAGNPKSFQPMNVNYGLFPPLRTPGRRVPKKDRNEQMSARALDALEPFARAVGAVAASGEPGPAPEAGAA